MVNGLFVDAPSRGSDAAEFAQALYKTPALVHHGVRCGKEGCRCRRGHLHGPYAFLYWRDQQGHQRRRYVRQADVAAVAAVVHQRRTADRMARRATADALANLRQLRQLVRDLERSEPW